MCPELKWHGQTWAVAGSLWLPMDIAFKRDKTKGHCWNPEKRWQGCDDMVPDSFCKFWWSCHITQHQPRERAVIKWSWPDARLRLAHLSSPSLPWVSAITFQPLVLSSSNPMSIGSHSNPSKVHLWSCHLGSVLITDSSMPQNAVQTSCLIRPKLISLASYPLSSTDSE